MIEIKKIYIHPFYQYPNLYNDIAILELGRRIEYGFDKFGDTPTCMDKPGQDNVNNIATVRGYGLTENANTPDKILEANVTVLSNEQCKEFFIFNLKESSTIEFQILTGKLRFEFKKSMI